MKLRIVPACPSAELHTRERRRSAFDHLLPFYRKRRTNPAPRRRLLARYGRCKSSILEDAERRLEEQL
jgi:hypothetical protein